MKIRLLALCLTSLATASVCYADTYVRKDLSLSDDNYVLELWNKDNSPNKIEGNTLTLGGKVMEKNESGEFVEKDALGCQSGWLFEGENAIKTADWDRLVVKLSNVGSRFDFRISQDWAELTYDETLDGAPDHDGVEISYSDVLTLTIDLKALNGTKTKEWTTSDDNQTHSAQANFTISEINRIYFWNWVGPSKITVNELYLEKGSKEVEPAKDFALVDLSKASYGDKVAFSYPEISFQADWNARWTVDLASYHPELYKYMVIVPAKPYLPGGEQFKYIISDGTNEIEAWGFAYGAYQPRRQVVLDLEQGRLLNSNSNLNANESEFNTKVSDENFKFDFKALQSLTICQESRLAGTFDIAAVYFTNDAPVFNNSWNFVAADHRIENLEQGNYGTICLPYASAVCGADIYEVAGVNSVDKTTTVYLKSAPYLLEAGKAYVYCSNTANVAEKDGARPEFNGGHITFHRAGAMEVSDPVAANGLTGSFMDDATVPADAYYLAMENGSPMWVRIDSETAAPARAATKDVAMPKYGAYLVVDADTPVVSEAEAAEGNSKAINVAASKPDVPTGIESIEAAAADARPVYYNLQGMRVDNPTSGLYIRVEGGTVAKVRL